MMLSQPDVLSTHPKARKHAISRTLYVIQQTMMGSLTTHFSVLLHRESVLASVCDMHQSIDIVS